MTHPTSQGSMRTYSVKPCATRWALGDGDGVVMENGEPRFFGRVICTRFMRYWIASVAPSGTARQHAGV